MERLYIVEVLINTANSLIEWGASKWQTLRECGSSGASPGNQVSKYQNIDGEVCYFAATVAQN